MTVGKGGHGGGREDEFQGYRSNGCFSVAKARHHTYTAADNGSWLAQPSLILTLNKFNML
jgi:hypothetical protein